MTQQMKLDKAHTVIGCENGVNYVQYHATKIVQWTDKWVKLDHGGHKTSTTKRRMNAASTQFDLGFHIVQRDHQWRALFGCADILFQNYMMFGVAHHHEDGSRYLTY